MPQDLKMNLNDDLKWQIFMLNATDINVKMKDRLQATISSSQVCASWRNILLSSASIWGQLIYITEETPPDLVEEILRRSESSPLRVAAVFIPESITRVANFAFFVRIIEVNWFRVERLEFWLDKQVVLPDLCQPLWAAFQHSAPLLYHFDVSMPPIDASKDAPDLFNDQAPSLREFDCMVKTVPTYSSWMKNLTFLHFIPASTTQLLSILSSASALTFFEGATLEYTPNDVAESPPIALLPSLKTLNLVSRVDLFSTFWPAIIAPEASTGLSKIKHTICFKDDEFPVNETDKHVDARMEAINRIMHYHDNFDPPILTRTVFIDMTGGSFSIALEPYSEIRIAYLGSSTMHFYEVFMYFISLFSPIYKNATNVKVRNYSRNPLNSDALQLWTTQMQYVTDLKLESIHKNQFLSTLTENCDAVTSISNEPDCSSNILFPALQTIRVEEWSEESLLALKGYLHRRSNVLKAPIKYLYINLESEGRTTDQHFFDGVDDLEVIWG